MCFLSERESLTKLSIFYVVFTNFFSQGYDNNVSVGAEISATVRQAKRVKVLYIETRARIRQLILNNKSEKMFLLCFYEYNYPENQVLF